MLSTAHNNVTGSTPGAPRVDQLVTRRQAGRQTAMPIPGCTYVEEGGKLTMYYASGKKKHDRVFWLESNGFIRYEC